MRIPSEQEYCHELLGDRFAQALSVYDTCRRVEVLVHEFLLDEMVRGKTALDVGCGLGFFSEALQQRGANVTACDIGPTLLERTRQRVGCKCELADALQLIDHFGRDRFDLIVSSECIEHTPSPAEALRQMATVLKPGGYLAISTPNIIWTPVVKLATVARLRPFDGYENFSSWKSIRKTLRASEVSIIREYGLHLFPFQLGLHRMSRWCDRHLQIARNLMINVCILGRKQSATQ
jgi:2-polyprenyl-3-methyl-5-hydroxy-6-metoxy-1,4-benzoquinol methylase